MKCFNHPEVDAVGICKSCARGLCHHCITEVGTSVSCKNRCESDVTAINDILQRGRVAYQKTSRSYQNSAIFMVLMGGIFLTLGVVRFNSSGPDFFLLTMGILFLGYGIALFVTAKRFRQK